MKNVVINIEKQLESFFSKKNPTEDLKPTDFEISKDLYLLDEMGRNLPEETIDRVILLFTKLTLFFERGILLEKVEERNFTPQILFKDGQLMAVDGFKEGLRCELPAPSSQTILKLKNIEVLNTLKMQAICNDDRLTCLLFQPIPEFAFILFSSMPDLWLKDHAKLTLEKLIKNINP